MAGANTLLAVKDILGGSADHPEQLNEGHGVLCKSSMQAYEGTHLGAGGTGCLSLGKLGLKGEQATEIG